MRRLVPQIRSVRRAVATDPIATLRTTVVVHLRCENCAEIRVFDKPEVIREYEYEAELGSPASAPALLQHRGAPARTTSSTAASRATTPCSVNSLPSTVKRSSEGAARKSPRGLCHPPTEAEIDHGTVTLRVGASARARVDRNPGRMRSLSRRNVDELFRPFEQRSADRTGLGLGLAFSRCGVEANSGRISARNLPNRGYVFTLDLPRVPVPAVAMV